MSALGTEMFPDIPAVLVVAVIIWALLLGWAISRGEKNDEVVFSTEDEERLAQFARAGGCPKCGSVPGMPCDAALHS